MTRRKVERTVAVITRELPHHIIVGSVDDGGQILWDVSRLCAFLGGAPGGRRPGNAELIYCFPTPHAAAEFARRMRDCGFSAR